MSHRSPYSCPAIREDIDFKFKVLGDSQLRTKVTRGRGKYLGERRSRANRIRKSVADESTI